MGHVGIGATFRVSVNFLVVETVHPALRAGKLPRSVASEEHTERGVIDLVNRFQRNWLQRYLTAGRISPAARGIGPGISLKHIVEAAVLLNDIDDVTNLSGATSVERSQKRVALDEGDRRCLGGRAGRKRGDGDQKSRSAEQPSSHEIWKCPAPEKLPPGGLISRRRTRRMVKEYRPPTNYSRNQRKEYQ
jgi:hypothetical protein